MYADILIIFFIENGMMKKKLSNQNKSDYKRDC